MIPALMITYGRLEYTKKAVKAILESDVTETLIFDNGSLDGTHQWLRTLRSPKLAIVINHGRNSIATAMNYFLDWIKDYEFCVKVDNDTLIPKDFCARMLPHMKKADLVQARHQLIPASGVGTFDEWVAKMPGEGNLKFNSFIGGSGIMMRRRLINRIPETENNIMGWRAFQREHPELVKAFALDVEIELLDTSETGVDYSKYKDYYTQTGRL